MGKWVECAACREVYNTSAAASHYRTREHQSALRRSRERREEIRREQRAKALIRHIYGLCQNDPCMCYAEVVPLEH